jgi:nitrite reductase/ring-hydroxylating ferredoxin subunit
MSNITRRGFLASAAALAAAIVVPVSAQAATWFKIASTTYFKLNQVKIVRMRFYQSSGKSQIVKYGTPYSVLRTTKGVYIFQPMCSKDGREMIVRGKVLHCNICGSNFNPKTGGPIVPSAATVGLRRVTTRVRSGAIQIVPFA